MSGQLGIRAALALLLLAACPAWAETQASAQAETPASAAPETPETPGAPEAKSEEAAPLSGPASGSAVQGAAPGPAAGVESEAVSAMRALLEGLRGELEALKRLRAAQEQLVTVNELRGARGAAALRLPCARCLASPARGLCHGPALAMTFDCPGEGPGKEPGAQRERSEEPAEGREEELERDDD